MKLTDLIRTDLLERPTTNVRNVDDGAYTGVTSSAEYVERESKFSEDGIRVVLNIGIEVENKIGDIVKLYISPNYSWSNRGHMIKILEKLEALPKPGQSIRLEKLIGIPVQVIVENTEKDGVTYSNIVSIKKIEKTTTKSTTNEIEEKINELVNIDDQLDKLLSDDLDYEDADIDDSDNNGIDVDDLNLDNL